MVIQHLPPRLTIPLLCLHVGDDAGYQLLERPVEVVKRGAAMAVIANGRHLTEESNLSSTRSEPQTLP